MSEMIRLKMKDGAELEFDGSLMVLFRDGNLMICGPGAEYEVIFCCPSDSYEFCIRDTEPKKVYAFQGLSDYLGLDMDPNSTPSERIRNLIRIVRKAT